MLFSLDGFRCFAEVLGTGHPLVCIHGGFGLDHSYFRPWLDPLSRDLQLILLDVRGHGRGDPLPRESFRIDAVVADLEAIRQQLGIDRWALLGHSGGGLVAGSYVAAHPERTSHFIVVGGFPQFPFVAPRWIGMAQHLKDRRILNGFKMFTDGVTTDVEYREACLRIAPLFFADPHRADVAPFERIIYRVHPFLEATTRYSGYDVGPRVTAYRGPALLLHGDQDYRVPIVETRKWQTFLPQAQLVTLPDAGHFPFIEQGPEICRILHEFVTTQ
ncbi:MAG: alpha/beta hydrolase [Deltaproteobacteria bacterium]|nr:alpha/beta hydrolase [Deltaproteobacteria bacterium]